MVFSNRKAGNKISDIIPLFITYAYNESSNNDITFAIKYQGIEGIKAATLKDQHAEIFGARFRETSETERSIDDDINVNDVARRYNNNF